MGVACDNASNNDAMIKSLSRIISHFPGAANRARCTAHIVNLVSKIILRQFDARKRSKGRDNSDDEDEDDDDDEENITSLQAEDIDREEQEVADDEDVEMSENIAGDLEEIEEEMKDDILEVQKKVKPIQRVLFKV
jgi:hypothetical protein